MNVGVQADGLIPEGYVVFSLGEKRVEKTMRLVFDGGGDGQKCLEEAVMNRFAR